MEISKDKFEEWVETHFEIVSAINDQLNNGDEVEYGLAYFVEKNCGRGGLFMLARDLTDKFQQLHENTIWGYVYLQNKLNFIKINLKNLYVF